ncbi:hypothetical protein CAEBREN_13590 [Caenorhabditis brenneri]|uniref:Uncharacterized protein n=1 Tax=Caenorhabditis brenneri TaxID=135651 RepID=G0N125_CAEBE|nr:hypothetical protein CAEBREN_13590 [Caenorhabditis brenneri]
MSFKVVSFLIVAMMLTAQAAPVEKTPEETRAELLAAGLSPQAVDGLYQIFTNAQSAAPKDSTPSPLEAFGGVIKLFQDIDAFMKTQSQQDQDTFKTIQEKKKLEFEAQLAAAKNNGSR